MRCFPALHGWDGARTSDGSWRTGTWVRSVSHYAIANSTSTGRPTRAPVAQTNRTSAHRRSSCFAIFFPVAIPERPHPFPSRTRKLSSPGPMVLQGQLCGRVGRYRGLFEQPASNEAGCSLFRARAFARTVPWHAPGPPPRRARIDACGSGAVGRGKPLGAGGGAPLGRAQTVLAPVTSARGSTDRGLADTEIARGRSATARGPGGAPPGASAPAGTKLRARHLHRNGGRH